MNTSPMSSMLALAEDAFRRAPIGSEITTHGVKMTVVKHRPYSRGFYGYGVCIHATPAVLVCEYRDNAGVIREYEFDQARFHLLLNAQVQRRPASEPAQPVTINGVLCNAP